MRELLFSFDVGRSTLGVGRWNSSSKPPTPNEDSGSAIFPIIVGDEEAALDLAGALQNEGFFVPAIRYPSVPKGSARLRVTVTAAHEEDQIHALSAAIKRSL